MIEEESDEPKPLGPRPLSKLEQQYMAQARERQKTVMVKPQTVCGVTFKGRAFAPSPEAIEFVDFAPGERYSARLRLTNTSRSFNTFKVLPFPPELADVLSVTYEHPGRLSAGTGCALTVHFNPVKAVDVEAELRLLCETGPEAVPIRCSRRRAAVSVGTRLLDFENVRLGEAKTLHLELKNGGWVGVRAQLRPGLEVSQAPDGDDGDDGEGGQASASAGYGELPPALLQVLEAEAPEMVVAERAVFSWAQEEVELGGYSTHRLAITFRPLRAVSSSLPLLLTFGGVEGAPDATVALTGSGQLVPVFVSREVVDMKAMLIGSVYRDRIVVGNRGSSALKISVSLPKPLQACAECVPAVAFVQAGSSCGIMLRVTPSAQLLAACGDAADVESGVVQLPVAVRAVGQTLPALFLLRMQLTRAEVEISPRHLDFGACVLGGSVGRTVRLRNCSLLKVDFGFVGLPAEIEVEPGDGLGSLLPFETVELVVRYSPRSATRISQPSITLSTTLNRSWELRVSGQGREAALQLSASTVRFGATPFGGSSSAPLEVRSLLRYATHFELRAPSGLPFRASPTVLWLEPGQAARVLLLFEPKDAEQPAQAAADAAAAAGTPAVTGASAGAGAPGGRRPQAEQPQGPSAAALAVAAAALVAGSALALAAQAVEYSTLLRCYVQQQAAAAAAAEGKPRADGAEAEATHDAELTQFVRLEGCALPAVVVFESGAGGGVEKELSFGTVAVGQAVSQHVRLLNLSAESVPLAISELDPAGPFRQSNAVRTLEPHGQLELTFQFAPRQEASFFRQLTIECPRGALRLALLGRGSTSRLQLRLPEKQPLPVTAGTLHLGATLVGDRAKATFSLSNESDFELPFELALLAQGHQALSGLSVIELSPRTASVKPRSELQIVATFAPDCAGCFYFALFELRVPNEKDRQTLCVRGHAYASAAWLLPPSLLAAELADSAPGPSSVPRQQLLLPVATGAPPLARPQAAASVIELQLQPDAQYRGSADLRVGHAALSRSAAGGGSEAKATAVEFVVGALSADAVALGFSCETAKGSVEAGASSVVTFRFSPSCASLQRSNLGIISAFGMAQWTETRVQLSLKGGTPPPEQPEVTIVLRGFVPTTSALAEAEAQAAAQVSGETQAAPAGKRQSVKPKP